MRALIFGGSGLVGTYLTKRLIKEGFHVTVVSRSNAICNTEVMSVVSADISRNGAVTDICRDSSRFDLVIHLAYATSGDDYYDRTVTYKSVVELADSLSEKPPNHFIYVGSMSCFGIDLTSRIVDELSPKVAYDNYSNNKIDACNYLHSAKFNFPISILHPTGVYDKYSKRLEMYRNILKDGYIVFNAKKKGINNIIHADDVARACIEVTYRKMGNNCDEYIITGEEIYYLEWFRILERELGTEARVHLPALISPFLRGPIGALFRQLQCKVPIIVPRYKRALFERETSFSAEKARSHWGYQAALYFNDVMKSSL